MSNRRKVKIDEREKLLKLFDNHLIVDYVDYLL
jgi:hypothetical protein